MVFQIIPSISTTMGIPVILMPLTFIVLVTMIKDLYEDQMRKNSDRKENELICETYNNI